MAASVAGLVALLVVIGLTAGLVLLILAGRGWRTHPSCGRCGYDVTASIGSVARCPECGSEFAAAGILPARRSRRPLFVGLGGGALVLGLTCAGSLVVSAVIARYERAERARAMAAAAQAAAMARLAEAEARATEAARAGREAAGPRDAEAPDAEAAAVDPAHEASGPGGP